MTELERWLDAIGLSGAAARWSLAALLAVLVWLGLGVARRVLRARLAALVPRTASRLDDLLLAVVARTRGWFVLVLALWAGRQVVELPARAALVAHTVFVVVLLLQAGLWAGAALSAGLESWRLRREADPGSAATFSILHFLGLTAIWALVLLMTLDNLGFDVTALVAGLGIGGIAVALAAQNVLGDLFASLAIALDKPFAVKDVVGVGEFVGTVEKIGIKTTRLRSLWGEQLVFSNTDLLASRLRNFGRMHQRRVVFTLALRYDTPRARLRRIPALLREVVEARGERLVRFDRAHFKGFGPSSLDFEVAYELLTADVNAYMDCQQEINLAILEAFEQAGVALAFPTQTLVVQRARGGTPDVRGDARSDVHTNGGGRHAHGSGSATE